MGRFVKIKAEEKAPEERSGGKRGRFVQVGDMSKLGVNANAGFANESAGEDPVSRTAAPEAGFSGFRNRSGGTRGEAAEAKRKRQSAYVPAVGGPSRQQVEAAQEPTRRRGFFSRLGDTVKGGAKGSLASDTNALSTAYEMGQGGRDAQNREYLEEYAHDLERAKIDLEAMRKANREAPGSWDERDLQSQQRIVDEAQQKYDAMAQVINGQVQQKATRESYQLADEIQRSAAGDIDRAKEGLGDVGRVLVDAGASMTQTALDAAANTLLGTPGSMGAFAVRAFGGGTQQARLENPDSTLRQQVLYGTASAAKEVFTERMFNMALPFRTAYGSGSLDEAVERGIRAAVDRFAETEAGRRALGGALTFASGAVGEGLEELIGDWMEWQMPRIYGGDAAAAEETLKNSLYDFLVGSASGMMGGAVTPGTYRYGVGVEGTGAEGVGAESNGTEGTGGSALLRQAAEEAAQNGHISNRTAERILADEDAAAALGLSFDPAMTKSQRRSAVKDAVSALAEAEDGAPGGGRKNAREAQAWQETAPGSPEDGLRGRTDIREEPREAAPREQGTEELSRNVGMIRRAAAALGRNGSRALTAAYDGNVKADSYYAGFAAYYEAGVSGIDMEKVQSRYAAQLNQAQRFAAYSAGQNDAVNSLALEREGVKGATVYGDEAGFVQSEHSASLPKETVRFYNSLARAAGVKIQMAEATGEGGANGWYSNGTIHIASDAENPGTVVAKHEITHRMQEMAPEAYRKYRDYAMAALTERDGSTASIVEQYKSRYAEAGVNLSTEQAMDEIAADFTEALTVDPARFETLAKENRSVAQRLLDAVRDFIRRVKSLFKGNRDAQNQAAANAYGVSIGTLEEAARLWEEALKATGERMVNRNAVQTDGEAKFSIKRTSQMTLAQQLKMFYDGKMASSDAFYFGETPAVLEKSGFDALPLAMTIRDFRKSTQIKHNIPRRVLKNLMGNLASPLFSFGSGERAGIVLNDIDGDGYTLLAALERGTDMDRKPVNVIHSLYGLEHPAEWIKNQIDSGSRFVLYDEKRANAFLQTYGYMASVGDGIRSTGESVPQNGAEVKTKFSLKTVPPVRPTSGDWKPGATFDEVKTAHPTLFALDADEADTRNPTQITGTVKSYRKIYDALKAEDFDGTILDASSGLGYGTRAGREEYGFAVDDIEPFPDAKYQPNYTDYSTLDKTYDVIISNAVLNVMPQDLRDAMVVKIGEMLNPGGRAFINVRGTDVKNAGSKVAINDDLMEYFISNTGSYQKGFTSKELVSYLKDALGDGFTVEPTRKFGAVSAIVTRDGDRMSLKGRDILQENAALQEENRLLREQMKDYMALRRRNGELQESRDYWRGQTRRTQRVTTDKKAVAAAAKQLIQSYGADIAVGDIQGELQGLYDYIASGHDGKNELTYTEARRRAENIAQTLVGHAVAVDSDLYDAYSDLRDYLRKTRIVYGKENHGDIADYGDFRKRQFGRLNLGSEGRTNIDQVYQELSDRWPEFFSEQEQTQPSDQLLRIAEVLDGIGEINEYNPFSRYMDQAVTGAANEIMEAFFDLPQTQKTFADRQALKLEEAKARGREQARKVREQNVARLAELREQNRQRVQNAIARERETRARQMGALKDRYAAKDAAGRERRAARELRAKITRHASALSQKLLRPSDQQHIPEAMRGSVAAMLESINQESQYTLDENGKRVKDGSGTPTKRTEAFRALKEQYAKIVAEGGDMVIDPFLLGSDADGIRGGFDAVIAMRDIKLADMSVEQLQTVWQVVKAVEHSVSTAGKILSKAKYAKTADWAQALSIGTGSRRAKSSFTRSHALIDLETPYTFFSHYGEAGEAVYRMLRDAQDQQQLMVGHVTEEVRKVVSPKTVKELEAATQTFTTERGEELTLSTAQVMELYELVKRKQAHDHLLKGGVVQPEIKSAGIQRGTDSIRLTEGDLANITGTLTPEQVKIADGLQGLTCGVLADYGNRASMEAYGYRKFTEKDYWPIRSAREGLHSSIEKGGSNTRSIKNIGMAKTTMPHASNALDLGGIFTTFANHASDMTDYASWLCTMEDINRLFNYQFRDEEGNPTGKTIKGLLDRVGGPGSQKYWHNLMEDIQNGINAPGDSPMWDMVGKTIGGFKGAAVGANIRVVIQQPTAFFRAAAVLSPQDMAQGLVRGVTRGGGWKKALQYSPIAMRKDAGGFDISSPHQMTETLFDNRTKVRKLNDALSAPAGAADAVTWGKLWNACEWATAREHQGLTKGSEAFYRQTAKRFAEVIDQTQVVDGVLQRSNIMRSSNAVVKQATSFMGEPIMSLNLLMRAYDQVRYEQNSQKRGQAIRMMGRAAAALVVTNVVNALAQSLIDAMRDDDEDKKYWERFLTAFTGVTGDEKTFQDYLTNILLSGNVGSNNNPLGQIPFVKDVVSMAQGYSVARTDMEVISDIVDASKLFISSAGGGKKTTAYAVKSLLASTAKLFGIPASNLTRDIWAAIRTAAVETDNVPLQYEMEKAIYNISNSGNRSRFYDILYRAYALGDTDVYERIYADMVASGIPEDKIRAGMESRMKRAQGVRSVDDLENRYLAPGQKQSYDGTRQRIAKTSVWQAASSEQREALETDLYNLTVANSDGRRLQEKIDGGAAYGIDETDYLLYLLALQIADRPSESGKLGSYTAEEVETAIDMLPGLDDEARAYLWAAAGKSEKSSPYQ